MPSQTLIVGTGADDASVGTVVWANPGNITLSDDVRAIKTLLGTDVVTHYLKGTNCGFTVPAGATIDGIVVEIDRYKTVAGSQVRDSAVRIVKADGSIGTTNKGATTTDWPTTTAAEATASYGSSTDLWGETWTVANINDVDFGAVVAATNPSATAGNAGVDFIRITVHYTEGGANLPLAASASVAAATLAASAQTHIPLAASVGGAAPTLALAALTAVSLEASAAATSASAALSAQTLVPSGPAAASSSATLTITAPSRLTFSSSASSSATFVFVVPAGMALDAAVAAATAVVGISAATGVPLGSSAGLSGATAAVSLFTRFTYGGAADWTYNNEDVFTYS